ncbi:hypothetical protein GMDG_08518 [Pseudogymnoascus destructans 20631-21]|uniref:Uncharacterized protein n=1 Tax=Pseudogymnoascus destructans (strain ATCC MYA-4855 / 20631-21) TaxID=658429 RepID=L8G4T8_PSED2|nr:hypothetical protein GMDG_08518 [Pseudogymnoascus destructans 20631-21]
MTDDGERFMRYPAVLKISGHIPSGKLADSLSARDCVIIVPEARLTEAERLAAVDALLEKKKATAAKAATTRARHKKAKEAAAQALAITHGADEEPLPSVEDDTTRPARNLSVAGPSHRGRSPLRPGCSDSVVDLRRRLPPRRKKAKLNLCLRCSKRVYRDRRLLVCEKKNPMSRCEYCVEQHNKCLPIPTFTLRQFNRLADVFQLYRDAIQRDEEAFSKTLANNRAKILAAVQEKYTAYVVQGKNLLRHHHRVGHDSQPQKVNLGLAVLEIASEVRSLRRTTRLGNDLQKAIHCHLPDVALAEEYESSDSEDDADREHVDGELEPDWELETVVG